MLAMQMDVAAALDPLAAAVKLPQAFPQIDLPQPTPGQGAAYTPAGPVDLLFERAHAPIGPVCDLRYRVANHAVLHQKPPRFRAKAPQHVIQNHGDNGPSRKLTLNRGQPPGPCRIRTRGSFASSAAQDDPILIPAA